MTNSNYIYKKRGLTIGPHVSIRWQNHFY